MLLHVSNHELGRYFYHYVKGYVTLGTFESHLCDHFNLNHDLSLTLIKWFLCINLTRT